MHFDLETDRRLAEFKLSVWTGADGMRQRGVVSDLVGLALDESGRRAELYVVGDRPIRYLNTTSASVGWALERAASSRRERFRDQFGSGDIAVSEFRRAQAEHVDVIDLLTIHPGLARLLEKA